MTTRGNGFKSGAGITLGGYLKARAFAAFVDEFVAVCKALEECRTEVLASPCLLDLGKRVWGLLHSRVLGLGLTVLG